MLDILDNRLAGCIALFVILVLSLWYIKPRFMFDVENNPRYLMVGNYEVNSFGLCVISISIFVYYIYAMVRYRIL